ncbi:MAG: HPF/RaiA family ribosome-associated protein [Burkholderiales bacterium]
MQVPLQITMRQMPHSDALEARIRQKAGKLDQYHANITGCQVTIEEDRRHQQQGRWFNVRIVVGVPGRPEIAVNHAHHEDPHAAVREAFDAVYRQLEDAGRQRGRDVARSERGVEP